MSFNSQRQGLEDFWGSQFCVQVLPSHHFSTCLFPPVISSIPQMLIHFFLPPFIYSTNIYWALQNQGNSLGWSQARHRYIVDKGCKHCILHPTRGLFSQVQGHHFCLGRKQNMREQRKTILHINLDSWIQRVLPPKSNEKQKWHQGGLPRKKHRFVRASKRVPRLSLSSPLSQLLPWGSKEREEKKALECWKI